MSAVALLFPLGLALMSIGVVDGGREGGAASWLPRLLLLAAVAPALVRLGTPLARSERRYLGLLALVAVGNVASAVVVLATRAPDARLAADIVMDLQRQAFLWILAWTLALLLRYPGARRWALAGLAAAALVGAAQILGAFARFGAGLGGIARGPEFKMFASQLGLKVNPVVFATTLAGLLALPACWDRRLLRAAVGLPVVAAIAVSGARTAVVSVAGGALLYLALGPLERARRPIRIGLAVIACAAVAAGTVLFADALTLDGAELSRVTTGRFDLWVAAWRRFTERPLAGWGARSWKTELFAFVPGWAWHGGEDLDSSGSGGFHNSYLGLLADKGLLAFVPSMILLATLLRWSFALHRGRALLAPVDARYARIAPVMLFVLSARAFGESAGLFAEANGAVDFLAYAAAAVVVALVSDLEEARATAPALGDAEGGSHGGASVMG